ncbi:MAG: hypothetical protein ABIP55_01675 [Tepidisphaeraceae bacterium]
MASLIVSGVAAKADTKADPTGTWKVTQTLSPRTTNEEKSEFVLTLSRDGDKLTGRITGQDGKETTRFEAAFNDGKLSFRNRHGNFHWDYAGKLNDNAIKGSVGVFLVSGVWEAKRVIERTSGK